MTTGLRRLAIAGGIALLVVVLGLVLGYRWFQRGGPVDDRLALVGPETRAFVTFLASPDEKPTLDLFGSAQKRFSQSKKDDQPDWLRSLSEFLSGQRVLENPKLLFPLRGTALVESPGEGESRVAFVLSLGRMVNVLRMFLGVLDSESENESYHGEKIIAGREIGDWDLALIKNDLIVSRDTATIRRLIDRLKNRSDEPRLSDEMSEVLEEVDPDLEKPGLGAVVNDRASLASLWQLVTGAPQGAEVALPESFEGVGFRFGLVSSDTLEGDGWFYFEDEEAATGAEPELESAVTRTFAHYGLKPKVDVEQEGSRLHVSVEVGGLEKALDHLFTRLESAGRKGAPATR